MRGYLQALQEVVDPLQQLHLQQPLFVLAVDVELAMNVAVFIAAAIQMLKLFAPKVYRSRSMKFANYSLAFHGRHRWVDGELSSWKMPTD
jgi:hypothetical protein